MAEEAMICGLADWFAVTVLFRHAMGIQMPHTAIIPDRKDVVGSAKADGMAEETTHRLPLGVDRSLAESVRRKPGAMRAGEGARKIGDGGDHRRPGHRRRTVVRAIVAARVEPQRSRIVVAREGRLLSAGSSRVARGRRA